MSYSRWIIQSTKKFLLGFALKQVSTYLRIVRVSWYQASWRCLKWFLTQGQILNNHHEIYPDIIFWFLLCQNFEISLMRDRHIGKTEVVKKKTSTYDFVLLFICISFRILYYLVLSYLVFSHLFMSYLILSYLLLSYLIFFDSIVMNRRWVWLSLKRIRSSASSQR